MPLEQRASVIVAACAAVCAVPLGSVYGSRRDSWTVAARWMAMRIMRERLGLSGPEIARALHRPNHSTVFSALAELAARLERGEERLNGSAVPLAALLEACGAECDRLGVPSTSARLEAIERSARERGLARLRGRMTRRATAPRRHAMRRREPTSPGGAS